MMQCDFQYWSHDHEVDHYKIEVCFTVVYAMLDFREIAVSAQLGFTSSYMTHPFSSAIFSSFLYPL